MDKNDLLKDIKSWMNNPENFPSNQDKYMLGNASSYYQQLCKIMKFISLLSDEQKQFLKDVNLTGEGFELISKTTDDGIETIELNISYKGTVTSIIVGEGLTGGIITDSGTISIDTDIVALKEELDDYIVKDDAPGYADILTQTDASTTYETQTHASNTYETKANVTTLAGRVTTNENDINTLDSDIVNLETSVSELESSKQDNLIAGENITITRDSQNRPVISATGDVSISYNELTNKPSINGYTINGSMAGEDLGLVNSEDLDNYIVKDDAPGYADILTQTDASTTYETQTHASNTYETIANVTTLAGRVTTNENDINTLDSDIVNLETSVSGLQTSISGLQTSKQDTLSSTQLNAVNSGINASTVAKLLLTPVTAPQNDEIVGIGDDNAQIRIQIDTNTLELTGSTSPFTLKAKTPNPTPYSYVGMVIFNTLSTESKVKQIYGSTTSWTLLASKLPIGENVYGNGKALGFTNGTLYATIRKQSNSRNTSYNQGFGDDVGVVNQNEQIIGDGKAIGVPTKAQLGATPKNSGLVMDSITVYIWQRTA